MLSKFETKCKNIIEEYFGETFISSYRPDFLKNPETKRNLEIDLFDEKRRICYEFQGIQHFCYPNIFHKSMNDFIAQVRRDDFKIKRLQSLNFTVIRIPYTFDGENLKEKIIALLEKKGINKNY